MIVPMAVSRLDGERHAPEMLLPISAVRDYAKRYRLTDIFVTMVQRYDQILVTRHAEQVSKRLKKKGA